MKVSLNLAQEFSNVDLLSIPRDELLKRIGAQLGAVEEVIDWAPKFEGATVVYVAACEKHPNADRLNVCLVDDGGKNTDVERNEEGLVQVVCGAPNVRAGMFAVWLAPGVTVPSSRDTDPFVLEAREIRGKLSNGMMASPHELGLSDDHSGILDITATDTGITPQPGDVFSRYFGLDDFVIDCENKMFTHRPDCFGVLGVAREFAGIVGQEFKSPSWYLENPEFEEHAELLLGANNQVPNLVPRFMAVAMQGAAVKPSPMWLQTTLVRAGIKPINNIVDVTNYVMYLTAQPLHAFDYDKIKTVSAKPGIFPRLSKKGEKITLLGQKQIELTGEEVVISTDKQAVALAGVMGGADTEVDQNTRNIIIECATFDMYNVRRTSMRHGLFTDAVTRFNKGQSPRQNDRVLAYAIKLMNELTGATQASHVYDLHEPETLAKPHQVNAGVEFINKRLGSELSGQDMKTLLENVEFAVEVRGEELEITVPFWRTDIEIPEDIVEEIGRLHGYDRLPVTLPKRSSSPAPVNKLHAFKQQLRTRLAKLGANEVLTYSFVHGDLLRKTGTDPEKWAYHIRNAISPDLQYYRTSLSPSLLAKIHPNIKAGAGDTNNQFALFEIGKAHVIEQKEDGLPKQMERLAMVVTADDKTAKTKQSGAAYYLAKKYLDELTDGQATYEPLEETNYPITAPYQTGRSAIVAVNGEILGVIGEFNAKVQKDLKLPAYTAGFELDIEALQKQLKPQSYQPLPAFPQTTQDITIDSSNKTFLEVESDLAQALELAAAEHGYQWKIEPTDIFAPEGSDSRKLTFRITLWHSDRTLTTTETNTVMQKLSREV